MKYIFVFIASLLFLSNCNEPPQCEEEIYLIHEGFRGKIMVFFNQPDGQPTEYENSARVYHIPASGFIKSQFPKNGGCMGDGRILFFYEDNLGNRQPIDYFLNMDRQNLPTDRDYVLFTFLNEKGKKPDFVIHFVGKLAEFNELTESVRNLDPVSILDTLQ